MCDGVSNVCRPTRFCRFVDFFGCFYTYPRWDGLSFVMMTPFLYCLRRNNICTWCIIIPISGEKDRGLGERVKDLVEEQSGRRPTSVHLLTHLAYFGYFFSPVSFYYCHDDVDDLQCIVAEVIFLEYSFFL